MTHRQKNEPIFGFYGNGFGFWDSLRSHILSSASVLGPKVVKKLERDHDRMIIMNDHESLIKPRVEIFEIKDTETSPATFSNRTNHYFHHYPSLFIISDKLKKWLKLNFLHSTRTKWSIMYLNVFKIAVGSLMETINSCWKHQNSFNKTVSSSLRPLVDLKSIIKVSICKLFQILSNIWKLFQKFLVVWHF